MTVATMGRAFDLYRRTATSRSAVALLIANAIPLVGVLFFGWSLLTILVLFWIENGIVGFWNVPRILMARQSLIDAIPAMLRDAGGDEDPEAVARLEARFRQASQGQIVRMETSQGRTIDLGPMVLSRVASFGGIALAVFFLIHYGLFWVGHGIFVFAIPTFLGATSGGCLGGAPVLPPGFPLDPGLSSLGPCPTPFGDVVWSNVTIAAIALFLSHGASFLLNYVGRREYLTTSPIRQMTAPYGRVVVLHLTIIFGGIFAAFLGAPVAALVILVVLKTALDLRLHLRQHRTAPAEIPALAASG